MAQYNQQLAQWEQENARAQSDWERQVQAANEANARAQQEYQAALEQQQRAIDEANRRAGAEDWSGAQVGGAQYPGAPDLPVWYSSVQKIQDLYNQYAPQPTENIAQAWWETNPQSIAQVSAGEPGQAPSGWVDQARGWINTAIPFKPLAEGESPYGYETPAGYDAQRAARAQARIAAEQPPRTTPERQPSQTDEAKRASFLNWQMERGLMLRPTKNPFDRRDIGAESYDPQNNPDWKESQAYDFAQNAIRQADREARAKAAAESKNPSAYAETALTKDQQHAIWQSVEKRLGSSMENEIAYAKDGSAFYVDGDYAGLPAQYWQGAEPWIAEQVRAKKWTPDQAAEYAHLIGANVNPADISKLAGIGVLAGMATSRKTAPTAQAKRAATSGYSSPYGSGGYSSPYYPRYGYGGGGATTPDTSANPGWLRSWQKLRT
jgi:hypothetical protein